MPLATNNVTNLLQEYLRSKQYSSQAPMRTTEMFDKYATDIYGIRQNKMQMEEQRKRALSENILKSAGMEIQNADGTPVTDISMIDVLADPLKFTGRGYKFINKMQQAYFQPMTMEGLPAAPATVAPKGTQFR